MFSGLLDVLIISTLGEYIPCEIKLGNPLYGGVPIWDRMQITAYTMLLEEKFGTVVKRGLIYVVEQEKPVEIIITQRMRKAVEQAVASILKIVNEEERPLSRRIEYCKGCWYRWVCG